MKKWLTIFLPLFFMGACTMPETSIYRLHLPMDQAKPMDKRVDAPIAISVNSPRHLTQPYIVYTKSPYQIEISKYSKWDASPNARLQEVFRDTVASSQLFKEVRVLDRVPEGFYSLKITLSKFERSDTGEASYAELAFDVRLISPEGKELYQTAVSKTSKLGDRTFLSLAKGLSSALTEGAEEVRNNLEKALKTGTIR